MIEILFIAYLGVSMAVSLIAVVCCAILIDHGESKFGVFELIACLVIGLLWPLALLFMLISAMFGKEGDK